jgi:hypothetical protein
MKMRPPPTAFDFSQPTSPRLAAFRLQIGNDISVITPSGSGLSWQTA